MLLRETGSALKERCLLGGLQDEGEDEAQQCDGLGQRHADEHGRLDLVGHLGLASHALDRLACYETDADAGADGAETERKTGTENAQRTAHCSSFEYDRGHIGGTRTFTASTSTPAVPTM